MPGTTHVSSSSTDTPTPSGVRDDVDLDRTVWFGGGEAYHRATDWGPACVDQIGRLDEHTLGDAVDEGKRPCRQCEPVDYRRVATDGGVAVDDTYVRGVHDRETGLESALDYASEAVARAEQLDVDDVHAARVRLAEECLRVAVYAADAGEGLSRDLAIDDATHHLETVVDELADVDVTHPARHALQMLVAREELRRPEPTPEPAPAPSPSTSSTTSTSGFTFLKKTTAGTLSVLTGVFAGLSLANADFVNTVETSAGDAIVTSAPGTAFWVAVGLMTVSTLLVAYATTGGRR